MATATEVGMDAMEETTTDPDTVESQCHAAEVPFADRLIRALAETGSVLVDLCL